MQDLGTITPSLEEFRARAAGTRVIPVHIKILADSLTPIGIYRSLVLQNDQGEPVEAAHGTFRQNLRRRRIRSLGPLFLHRRILPLHPHHR